MKLTDETRDLLDTLTERKNRALSDARDAEALMQLAIAAILAEADVPNDAETEIWRTWGFTRKEDDGASRKPEPSA